MEWKNASPNNIFLNCGSLVQPSKNSGLLMGSLWGRGGGEVMSCQQGSENGRGMQGLMMGWSLWGSAQKERGAGEAAGQQRGGDQCSD